MGWIGEKLRVGCIIFDCWQPVYFNISNPYVLPYEESEAPGGRLVAEKGSLSELTFFVLAGCT